MRWKTADQSYAAGAEYLREHPEDIEQAWCNPVDKKGGSLFGYCAPNDETIGERCLTQLKNFLGGSDPASWERHTLIPGLSREAGIRLGKALVQDDRIPVSVKGITRDSLQGFVEWQERLDTEFASAASE